MAHILVVDDDADLRQLLLTALERDGHQVTALDRGSAVTEAHCRWAHCILLDVMMPGGGAALPPASGSVPWQTVPFSSSPPKPRRPTSSRDWAWAAMTTSPSPFRLGELRARVAAHLRRQHRTPQHRFRRGGLDFDLGEKAVYWGEQPVKLTRGEYAICEYLALHSGQTFSKEQIYEAVFGFDAPGDQAAVTEHIKKYPSQAPRPDCHPIDTVWGVGYRWKRDLP